MPYTSDCSSGPCPSSRVVPSLLSTGLRVDLLSSSPPLSVFLSGGAAGRRGDGVGGRHLLYILGIDLAVGFALVACCCFVVADARLLSPSSAGLRRPPTPVAGFFFSAGGFRGGSSAEEMVTKAGFFLEEGIVSGGAACLPLSHDRGGPGEVGVVAATGGRRSMRLDGGSGSGFRPEGGGSAAAARRGRGQAADLRSEVKHGAEPRSTSHRVKGFSTGGELLNRLTKPMKAMVLARICWIDGEEGGRRDLQGPLCKFLLFGVFSAFLPEYVFFLDPSRGFRMYLVVSVPYA